MRLAGAVAVLLLSAASAAADCTGDMSPEVAAKMQEILAAEGASLAEAEAMADLSAQHPDSFCLLHAAARAFMRAGDDARGQDMLATLESRWPAASLDDLFGETPWNTRGFAAIKRGRWDEAVEDLRRQLAVSGFPAAPDAQRLKIYNNLGYALLQLERYPEALEAFETAAALGSRNALRNIEATQSILSVLNAGDPDLPGVFAVVVETSRSYTDISRVQGRLRESGFDEAGAFHIYQRPDGKLSLTLGANESWPKAEGRLEAVRAAVPDAFVASTADWKELTAGISRGISLPRKALRETGDKGG